MPAHRISALVLLASLMLAAAPASAQRGLASRLGDPFTGAPAPEPARPSGTARERVPPPPGYELDDEIPEDDARAEPSEDGDDAPGPLEVQNRTRALDATWGTLGASGGPNIGGAILQLAGGGIQIVLGVLLLELAGPPISGVAPYFIVLGSTSILRTILIEFVLRPDPRAPAIAYQHMPSATPAQALERMRYGEAQLRALAEQSMIMRIVDGSLNIAGALAVIPAYLVPRNFELVDFEWLVLLGPAFALVSGIITLASPTPAEQRWAAYDDMRRRLRARRGRGDASSLVLPPPSEPSFSFGLAFHPDGGGFASVGGTF